MACNARARSRVCAKHRSFKRAQPEKPDITASGEHTTVRPTIADGHHVSARWKRVVIGPTWEHIQFREGDEWKGGARLAIRFARHTSAIVYVPGPGKAEFRAGLLIGSGKEKD